MVLGLIVFGVLFIRLRMMLWFVLWFLLVVLSELYSLICMLVICDISLLVLRLEVNMSVVCIGLIVCELDGLMLILKRLKIEIVMGEVLGVLKGVSGLWLFVLGCCMCVVSVLFC